MPASASGCVHINAHARDLTLICVHARTRTSVRACVREYMRACVCGLRACIYVCVRACVRACVQLTRSKRLATRNASWRGPLATHREPRARRRLSRGDTKRITEPHPPRRVRQSPEDFSLSAWNSRTVDRSSAAGRVVQWRWLAGPERTIRRRSPLARKRKAITITWRSVQAVAARSHHIFAAAASERAAVPEPAKQVTGSSTSASARNKPMRSPPQARAAAGSP